MKVPRILLLVSFSIIPVQLFAQMAQSNTSALGAYNPLDNTNVPARVAAMGSAFTGVADDASALFFNPAGLAYLAQGQAALLSGLGWVDNFHETGLVGLPLGRDFGGAASASYLSYGTFTGRDGTGALTSNYGADQLSFQAGMGIALVQGLSAGLGLREWQENLPGSVYSILAPELGALWKPDSNWKLGVDYAVALWGSWKGPEVSTLKAGASWEGALDSTTHLLVTTAGSFESNSITYLQAGLEASYKSQFFLRGGYQASLDGNGFSGLSVGAGASLAGFVLDYAYSPNGDLGDTHRFSLTYLFQTEVGKSADLSSSGGKSRIVKGQPGATGSLGTSPRAPQGMVNPASTPALVGTPSAQGAPSQSMAGSLLPASAGPPSLVTPQPDAGKGNQNRLKVSFTIPSDPTSQADLLASQGRLSEAVGLYQQALQQDPKDVMAWWGMGNAYYRLGQKKDAIPCFEKVLQLKPDDKSLSNWLQQYKAQNPAR